MLRYNWEVGSKTPGRRWIPYHLRFWLFGGLSFATHYSAQVFREGIPMTTRALITGGAGFIGSHLAERLLEQGQQVTIIDNLSTGQFENIAHLEKRIGFHYAIEDIRNTSVMD